MRMAERRKPTGTLAPQKHLRIESTVASWKEVKNRLGNKDIRKSMLEADSPVFQNITAYIFKLNPNLSYWESIADT